MNRRFFSSTAWVGPRSVGPRSVGPRSVGPRSPFEYSMGHRVGRHRVRWVMAVALASTFCTGCGEPEAEPETTLRPVRTVTVEPTSTSRSRIFSGTSRSKLESRLSFKVSGTVESIPIEVGETLEAGQLIAALDSSLLDLQAQQAEADLRQAQAANRNAAASYQRVKGLYVGNNASRDDLDSARAAAESSEAQMKAAEKRLELARLNVSFTRLYAKADCTVAAVNVEVNENVSVGSPIATVTCGSELEVELSVPESLIGELKKGMAATVTFDAFPGETFEGVVSEVGVGAGGGGAFEVTVALAGEHPRLRSGLAAEVSFQVATGGREQVILVPLAAVVQDGDGAFVYVAEGAGAEVAGGDGQAVVRRRDVQLGELTELGMEVVDGLNAGDQVITAGVSVIREGLEVLITSSVGEGE